MGWETNGEDGVRRRGGEEVSADSSREHARAHKTGVGGFVAAASAGYESDFGEGATRHIRTEDDLHLGMQQRGTVDVDGLEGAQQERLTACGLLRVTFQNMSVFMHSYIPAGLKMEWELTSGKPSKY